MGATGQPEQIDIQRLRSGEHDAFEALVNTFYSRVYRLALRMLGGASDAEDAAQEAFIRIHRSVARFKGGSSLATWIYRITYNTCLDEIRREKRRPSIVQTEDGADPMHLMPDPQEGPEDIACRSDASRAVRDGLQELSVEFRTVLILREIEDLSYDQIADVLQIPVGTVRSRLARGRRMLADILQGRVPRGVPDNVQRAAST